MRRVWDWQGPCEYNRFASPCMQHSPVTGKNLPFSTLLLDMKAECGQLVMEDWHGKYQLFLHLAYFVGCVIHF